MIDENLFNSFYSIVLLALCLIAFSNCSIAMTEMSVILIMESLRLVLKRKDGFYLWRDC